MFRALVLSLAAGVLLAAPAVGQVRLTPDEKEILHRLETYQLTMDFQEAPFEEVIEYLRLATSANIVIDPGVYRDSDPREMRVTLKVKNLAAMNALKLVLDLNKLEWIMKNGVLLVTTKEARQLKPYTMVYDIRDLMFEIKDFPGPDISLQAPGSDGGIGAIFEDSDSGSDDLTQPEVIVEILQENTGIGTWDDGSTGIQVAGGLLVVRQSEEVHREVERLLNMLRAYK